MILRAQRFAAAGIAATLLYGILAFSFERVGLESTQASIAAYGAAACFSYLAQRRAFASRRAHRQAAPRFAAAVCLGLALSGLVSAGAASFGLPSPVGVAAVCVVAPAMNFLLLDRVVFRQGA